MLTEHHQLLRTTFQEAGGHEVSTHGDEFFVVFPLARDAVAAAVAAQRALAAHRWPDGETVKVRMGLHTGEGTLAGDEYVGLDVHRAARISSAGWGGQILLSQATRALIDHDLTNSVGLRDLGPHRLKDLQRPEHIFQVLLPDLASDFPPLRSLDVLPNNLPVQLTSFIGREPEMAEVRRLLSTTRVLTLLGAGGAGKTRLALQVAADLVDGFPDGVWLAELAAISDPALVPQTVASALGLTEPARPAREALLEFLRPRSLLLLLDNCEQVLDASADLCAFLLRHCEHLRILATSREPLGVAGEVNYRVPPLSLPAAEQPPTPETANQYAAIRLFIERVVLYQPGFKLTAENVRAIADICRRLDGIPLAIELAAARVKVLSVEQIAARLDDRFRLLTGGTRTGLPHHQTLRAAMDWSYDLLTESERALFRRLSVFIGGVSLEAAERVCAGEGVATDDVLDLLSQLVDKSLVAVEDAARDQARYRLLETIRQYGLNRLVESEEAEVTRDRHRDFFLQFAERAEPELRGPDQGAWLDRLDVEHDNFRAALEWARTHRSKAERGLRLAGALGWFWEVRGYWIEGRRWLTEALSRAHDASAAVRVKALNAAARLALSQADFSAGAMAQESLELSRRLGDKRGAASCLVILGLQACRLENYTQAEALSGESLTLSSEVGDSWGTAWARVVLGLVARAEGDLARATALLEESLAQFRSLGHPWGIAMALADLGLVARDQSDYERARPLLEEALARFRQLGDKGFMAHTEIHLGAIASALGDYERADALYRDSLQWRKSLQEKRGIASCLAALGCAAAGLGHYERAATLFGAAEALREAIRASVPPLLRNEYDQKVEAASRGLGEAVFKATWAAGRAMPFEQAVEFALTG